MAFEEGAIIVWRADQLVILRKAGYGLLGFCLFGYAGKVIDYPADGTHGAQSFFNGKRCCLLYVDGFMPAYHVHNALHATLPGTSLFFKQQLTQ